MSTKKDDDGQQWKRMQFKQNKVWMATDDKGTPVVQNKKVRIKYQLGQDYEYWVFQSKVVELDASNPPPGQKPTRRKKPSQSTNSKPQTGKLPADRQIIDIYTDGASSGNPGPAGIGVVLSYGAKQKEISRYIGHGTNNIAELEAIRTALETLKTTNLPVRLHTDSSYALGVLTSGWKARKNQDLIASIKKRMAQFAHLEFVKVKGHAGHPGNERADQLATSAIKKQA